MSNKDRVSRIFISAAQLIHRGEITHSCIAIGVAGSWRHADDNYYGRIAVDAAINYYYSLFSPRPRRTGADFWDKTPWSRNANNSKPYTARRLRRERIDALLLAAASYEG